jgi:4'-phosphopantetheinyl transferase
MSEHTHWKTAPMPLALEDAAVDVWRAGLLHSPACVDILAKELSLDEWERADRFRFADDRARFIAARAALRRILGGAVGVQARRLRFGYGDFGKPFLSDHAASFNLSHAENVALCAVTKTRAVGVDVEKVLPLKEGEVIGAVFSRLQAAALRALPEPDRLAVAHAGWTRKEAYVKALGDGLNIPLESFDVSLREERDDVLKSEDGRVWRVRPLHPGAGFAGAVAVEGEDFTLRCWKWDWGCGCEA